jgi:hypothetical protein
MTPMVLYVSNLSDDAYRTFCNQMMIKYGDTLDLDTVVGPEPHSKWSDVILASHLERMQYMYPNLIMTRNVSVEVRCEARRLGFTVFRDRGVSDYGIEIESPTAISDFLDSARHVSYSLRQVVLKVRRLTGVTEVLFSEDYAIIKKTIDEHDAIGAWSTLRMRMSVSTQMRLAREFADEGRTILMKNIFFRGVEPVMENGLYVYVNGPWNRTANILSFNGIGVVLWDEELIPELLIPEGAIRLSTGCGWYSSLLVWSEKPGPGKQLAAELSRWDRVKTNFHTLQLFITNRFLNSVYIQVGKGCTAIPKGREIIQVFRHAKSDGVGKKITDLETKPNQYILRESAFISAVGEFRVKHTSRFMICWTVSDDLIVSPLQWRYHSVSPAGRVLGRIFGKARVPKAYIKSFKYGVLDSQTNLLESDQILGERNGRAVSPSGHFLSLLFVSMWMPLDLRSYLRMLAARIQMKPEEVILERERLRKLKVAVEYNADIDERLIFHNQEDLLLAVDVFELVIKDFGDCKGIDTQVVRRWVKDLIPNTNRLTTQDALLRK